MPRRQVHPGPRRRRDATATREAILEAATRRFAARGYDRAGVRAIAADLLGEERKRGAVEVPPEQLDGVGLRGGMQQE